ncbi:T9SS type B sorting domain-containing protein [Tenacibaculum sp. 190524A02b]
MSSDTVVVTQDLSTPIPPNVSEQLFCSIETPTGNDLVPTISNTVIWFKDSALTKILDTVEFLEEGTYYVVSKNIDTGCLSPAISVKITLRGSLDTDGDGLTDCEETTGLDDPLTIGVPTSISNPNNSCSFTGKPKPDTHNTIWQLSDCDGDNEINGDEIVNETNPNDPCSVSIKTVPDINNPNYLIWAQQDCDGDGVLNSNEVMDDTSPFDPCDFVPSSISEPITSNIKCISAIEVTKTASLTDKEVGDIIEYTIKVENIGTSTIMNISLSDIFTDIDGNPLELTEGVRFDGADYGSPEGTLLMGEAAIYKASFIITKEVINTGGVRNTVIAVGQDSSGELVEDISDDGDDTDGNIKDDPTVTDLGCLIVFNQFTPNNDDHNDVFIINCIKNYPKNTLEIFNRWGNTVYKKVGYDNSWDGISTGRATLEEEIKLPVGTYFYILDLGDGSEVKKGWIYINR